MAENSEYELVVSEGRRPIWKSILSAICFTIALIWLLADVLALLKFTITESLGLHIAKDIKGLVYFFVGGIALGLQKDILIDTDKNKLISLYHLGVFSKRQITEAPELEYVAVYLNPKDSYEVNLWYKGNRHYKMYDFEEKAQALDFGRNVADKLKIDLLDKTVRGESTWIEYKPS